MERPKYVQAWKIEYPDRPSMLVYDQKIALDKWSEGPSGTELTIMTIVRYANDEREYIPGAIASDVERAREGS